MKKFTWFLARRVQIGVGQAETRGFDKMHDERVAHAVVDEREMELAKVAAGR